MFNKMWPFTQLRHRPASRRRTRRPFQRHSLLAAEVLEERLLLFGTSITSAADIVDPSDGVVTLREAIQAVNSGTATELGHTDNFLVFDEALNGATIELAGQPLVIAADMTIAGPASFFFGPDQAEPITIHALGQSRVFQIGTFGIEPGENSSAPTVLLAGLTITGGSTTGSGGGIFNLGTLTLLQSTVAGNHAGMDGGGIVNNSTRTTVSVIDSTLVGNTAGRNGGGLANFGVATVAGSTLSGNAATLTAPTGGGGGILNAGPLTVSHSTITLNRTAGGEFIVGGGIYNSPIGSVALNNTIVAGNSRGVFADGSPRPDDIANDAPDAAINGAHNLIGDPFSSVGLLSHQNGNIVGDGSGGVLDINTILDTTLRDNGGPTPTHALVSGSPAINAGNAALLPADQFDLDADGDFTEPVPFDQRGDGFPRVVGAALDIGAYEGFEEVPEISIQDVTQAEGDNGQTTFGFLVRLSHPSSQRVSVDYATVEGTAMEDTLRKKKLSFEQGDYRGQAGRVTFEPGQTLALVMVRVDGDLEFEPDETFRVVLSNPRHVTIADGEAQGTIVNDDAPPPEISIQDVTQAEGDSGQTTFSFLVSLSHPSTQRVSVDYATVEETAMEDTLRKKKLSFEQGDYRGQEGRVTFEPGQTLALIKVRVHGDLEFEPDETFRVVLSNPRHVTIADGEARGTIVNDDAPPPEISIQDVSQAEGDSGRTTFSFLVSLSHPSAKGVTVHYHTEDVTASGGIGRSKRELLTRDYDHVSGQLHFEPGQVQALIQVRVHGDLEFEPNETFRVVLSNARDAAIVDLTATGTILNDDPPDFADAPLDLTSEPLEVLSNIGSDSLEAATVAVPRELLAPEIVEGVTLRISLVELRANGSSAPLLTRDLALADLTVLDPDAGDGSAVVLVEFDPPTDELEGNSLVKVCTTLWTTDETGPEACETLEPIE